jgi:choline dehydrogenase
MAKYDEIIVGAGSAGSALAARLGLYVKVSLDSAYHPVGTLRMGPASDLGSVVSERCAVHGVDSLYVCDASIMPSIVRAITNVTSIMIGERAADWLRDERAA